MAERERERGASVTQGSAYPPGSDPSNATGAGSADAAGQDAITLRRMGSFFFAGEVAEDEAGDTCHGDHGYAQFFIPEAAHNLPLILWHGLGQSGKTWESTPDGRDGFWQIFTRRGWPLYIIDQPRRGRAGKVVLHDTDEAGAVNPTNEAESLAWETYRMGPWDPPAGPSFFPGLQF